jgi:hypothetical protein
MPGCIGEREESVNIKCKFLLLLKLLISADTGFRRAMLTPQGKLTYTLIYILNNFTD